METEIKWIEMLILIDNYDSFTFNLVHYFGELGSPVKVYRNDEKDTQSILSEEPSGIIISPGPCNPTKAGVSLELTQQAAKSKVPLLGVCLGHQTIGQTFGGTVCSAEEVVHGKTDQIYHQGTDIFNEIPSPFEATRYHSLCVSRNKFPKELQITAEAKCGEIMALKHKILPIYGVQFHPESILTKFGHKILENFVKVVKNLNG